MSRCAECPYSDSTVVPGEGLDRPRIIVGMAPGFEESLHLQPFFPGSAPGRIVRDLVNGASDVGFTNAVQCFPGEVKTHEQKERFAEARARCRDRLLTEVRGKEVLCLGGDAAHSLLGRPVKITGFRGTVLPEGSTAHGGSLAAATHPSFVLRAGGLGSTAGQLFRRDVEQWLRPSQLAEPTFAIEPKTVKLPPAGTPVVVDIETTGLDPKAPGSAIRCYGFSWFVGKTPFVTVTSTVRPWVKRLLSGKYPLVAQNYVFEVKWLARHVPKMWHFRRWNTVDGFWIGLKSPISWQDTMLLAHCAHEDRGPGKYNLDSLAADYLPPGFPTKQALLGQYDVLTAPLDVLMPYCAWDCVKELLLFERFTKEVYGLHGADRRGAGRIGLDGPERAGQVRRVDAGRNPGAVQLDSPARLSRGTTEGGLSHEDRDPCVVLPARANDARRGRRPRANAGSGTGEDPRANRLGALRLERVAMPAALFLDRARDRGLRVDRDAVDRELTRVDEGIARCESLLNEKLGTLEGPINWGSDAQVRTAFKFLGLTPSGLLTETGAHSLDALARVGLMALNPEHVPMLQAFDELKRLRHESSDFRGPKGLVSSIQPDGRLHPFLNLTGTRTFRLSASFPPIHGFDAGRQRCIVPDPGKVLIEADYDGAEVAWAAFHSRDPWYVSIVEEGRSMHTDLATEIVKRFNLTLSDAEFQDLRRACKAINFGLQYGGGVGASKKVTDETVGWNRFSVEELERFVTLRKGMAPGYARWAHERYLEAYETGGVKSSFGAFMRIPGAKESRGEVLSEAKRLAANSPIQSDASDATLVRAMECEAAGIEVLLLRHDSILVQAPKRSVSKTIREMKKIMEAPRFYWGEMPWLRASFKTGKSWGEMEKVG